jgi:hypothetical protein
MHYEGSGPNWGWGAGLFRLAITLYLCSENALFECRHGRFPQSRLYWNSTVCNWLHSQLPATCINSPSLSAACGHQCWRKLTKYLDIYSRTTKLRKEKVVFFKSMKTHFQHPLWNLCLCYIHSALKCILRLKFDPNPLQSGLYMSCYDASTEVKASRDKKQQRVLSKPLCVNGVKNRVRRT